MQTSTNKKNSNRIHTKHKMTRFFLLLLKITSLSSRLLLSRTVPLWTELWFGKKHFSPGKAGRTDPGYTLALLRHFFKKQLQPRNKSNFLFHSIFLESEIFMTRRCFKICLGQSLHLKEKSITI